MVSQYNEFTVLDDIHLNGEFTAGPTEYNLASGGVGYSTSGDFLSAEMIATIDGFAADIVSGAIAVPSVPAEG